MFCPQCGSTQPDDLKYCKTCGANLHALRQVMASRETEEKFDWSKTWLAEMFESSEAATRRAAKLDLLMGRTPEEKRRNEIKAGIITASVGVGVSFLLLVLMGGIIASGRVSDAAVEILSRLWIVGILPFMIGIALIINGVFISKRRSENEDLRTDMPDKLLQTGSAPPGETRRLADVEAGGYLSPADTNELIGTPPSVTDETTRRLEEAAKRKAKVNNPQ